MKTYQKKRVRDMWFTIIIILIALGIIFWPQINSFLSPNKFKSDKVLAQSKKKQVLSLDSEISNTLEKQSDIIYSLLNTNDLDIKVSDLDSKIKLEYTLGTIEEKEIITEDEVNKQIKELFLEEPKIKHQTIECKNTACDKSYEYNESEKNYRVIKIDPQTILYNKNISYYKIENDGKDYYLSAKVLFRKDCMTIKACDEEENGKVFYYKDSTFDEVAFEKSESIDIKKVLEENFDQFKTYEFQFKKDEKRYILSKIKIKPNEPIS